jgi:hypothetical protein
MSGGRNCYRCRLAGTAMRAAACLTSPCFFLSQCTGSERLEPPVALVSGYSLLFGQDYWATASSSIFSHTPYYAFDKSTSIFNKWATGYDKYMKSYDASIPYGDYIGSEATAGVSGEYLQLQLPSVSVTNYTLTMGEFSCGRNPKQWTLFGSTDGTNWTVLDQRAGVTNWAALPEQTFTLVTQVGHYSYLRIVYEKTNASPTTGCNFGWVDTFELVFIAL